MSDPVLIKNALVSVFDKTELNEFGDFLRDYGVNIVSTGGTYEMLNKNGTPVTSIQEFAGKPEIMGGRVKTLQYEIYACILAKRTKEDLEQLEKYVGKEPFDMVVCNLYNFKQTVDSGAPRQDIVEKMDIGGPSMVNAAAKNSDFVSIVTDPTQYKIIMEEMSDSKGSITPDTREFLACEAENILGEYFLDRANWRNSQLYGGIPPRLFLSLEQAKSLKPELRKEGNSLKLPHGENPGYDAVAYGINGYMMGILEWKHLGGTDPSFNKLREAAKVHKILQGFEFIPTAITGKHGIISGLACSVEGIEKAYELAHACDPEADLGNETMLNRECTVEAAKMIGLDIKSKWKKKSDTVFTEGLGSDSYEEGATGKALEILKEKQNKKVTIFETGPYSNFPYDFRVEDGMFLCQKVVDYSKSIPRKGRWATRRKGNEDILDQMYYIMETAWRTPSNEVNVGTAKTEDGKLIELRTLGIGTDTKRSRAAWNALENYKKFNWKNKNAILASGGFFPKKDTIELAAEYEIELIIAPEGGIRKDEVVKEADDWGITMYFTHPSIRFFSH